MPPCQSGDVLLAIFDSPDGWMNMDRVFIKAAQPCPDHGAAIFEIPEMPAGTYACCVLIDTNSNQRMDFNIVGYPLEDYAFSNQAIGQFGPPSFESASFAHHEMGDTFLEIVID